jgi:hypothetical protein
MIYRLGHGRRALLLLLCPNWNLQKIAENKMFIAV